MPINLNAYYSPFMVLGNMYLSFSLPSVRFGGFDYKADSISSQSPIYLDPFSVSLSNKPLEVYRSFRSYPSSVNIDINMSKSFWI